MDEKLKEAIKKVSEELSALSNEEFNKKLKEHEGGDIAEALEELGFFERYYCVCFGQLGEVDDIIFLDTRNQADSEEQVYEWKNAPNKSETPLPWNCVTSVLSIRDVWSLIETYKDNIKRLEEVS